MTDQEYINAFRTDDQQTINRFYAAFRAAFLKAISSKFAIKDDYLLADIFQDTCIRLWRNIQGDRLTSDGLTSSLAGYLYGIGERVALEMLRKNKGKYVAFPEDSTLQQPGYNFQDDPYGNSPGNNTGLVYAVDHFPSIGFTTHFYLSYKGTRLLQ